MGKVKTKKAAKKRFKITASGRILRGSTQMNHLLTKKSSRRKRRLGMASEVTGGRAKVVRVLLPNDN
ncbi:MAG TPA: 50S ribosomal protein L35 [Armatimonadetes bacterium]|nr:50S ribosomal protein L35 [Armatimonadota bacterium]